MIYYFLSASGTSNIVVIVTDEKPSDSIVNAGVEGTDFENFGSHTGDVNEGDIIKIKPNSPVNGQYVIVYLPGEGTLSLGDVKVYVKPVQEPEEEIDNTDTESGSSSGETPETLTPDTCFTSDKQDHPWYSMNLGKEWQITSVKIAACNKSRKLFIHNT